MRVSKLLVAAPATLIGCSSLLDYDAIEFHDRPADDAGGTGGSGGDDAASGGGGTAGDTGGTAGSAGNMGGTGGAGGMGSTGGTSGSAGAPGGSGGSTGGAGGSPDPCASVTCGANQHCDPSSLQCVCNPGFVSNGSGCEPALPGDPSTHTQQEVCDHWNQGHQLSDPSPWSTTSSDECDPGELTRAGIDDTLARIAMFRWLVGLGPVNDDPALDEMNMWCAVVSSWNPPSGGYNPHSPDPSRKCYTAEGASGAGQSNIAWGSGHPAQAIDQFIEDWGNETTMGHRRWIFNPPLGPVGIGYYAGGGAYGDAECLAVFGSSGTGPWPEWISFPPPGYFPVEIASWMWTFHANASVSGATMTVIRQSDSQTLAMQKIPLQGGYGSYATVGFRPDGWAVAAGETYVVAVDGVGAGTITYELRPVTCY